MAVDVRPMLAAKAVAARLGVSERTVRDLIATGVLASVKIGGARRVEPQVLDAFIASRRNGQ